MQGRKLPLASFVNGWSADGLECGTGECLQLGVPDPPSFPIGPLPQAATFALQTETHYAVRCPFPTCHCASTCSMLFTWSR